MKVSSMVTVLCLALSALAQAENSVVVDSRTVRPGATGVEVGIWLKNDTYLTGLVIPLELRDTDGNGSFWTDLSAFSFGTPDSHRVAASPLMGSVTKRNSGLPAPQTCSGPVSNTYAGNSPPENAVSPDGFFWAGVSTNGPPALYYLPPGDDRVGGVLDDWPSHGDSTRYEAGPSLAFRFNVNMIPGTFEVDTCCFTPAVHLSGTDMDMNLWFFTFTMGVITIDPNLCVCPCLADPQCDSIRSDLADVTRTIDVAFRASAPVQGVACPHEDSDVNCSGWTDIVDAVKVIDVAFRKADPATEFCSPCGP